jgi:hypothetical protein
MVRIGRPQAKLAKAGPDEPGRKQAQATTEAFTSSRRRQQGSASVAKQVFCSGRGLRPGGRRVGKLPGTRCPNHPGAHVLAGKRQRLSHGRSAALWHSRTSRSGHAGQQPAGASRSGHPTGTRDRDVTTTCGNPGGGPLSSNMVQPDVARRGDLSGQGFAPGDQIRSSTTVLSRIRRRSAPVDPPTVRANAVTQTPPAGQVRARPPPRTAPAPRGWQPDGLCYKWRHAERARVRHPR